MNYSPVILGHIDIPVTPPRHNYVECDDCHQYLLCSHGDPRDIITVMYADGSKSIRRVCHSCGDDNFANGEPDSIFD